MRESSGIELSSSHLHSNLNVNNPDRPRTSTAVAREFQYLRQKMENEVEIDKARKTSRISRGLNPDAPKPPQPPRGILSYIKVLPRMRSKLRQEGRMTKLIRFKLWTSTRYPWISCATDSVPVSKQVLAQMLQPNEMQRKVIINCLRKKKLQAGSGF